MGVGKAVENPRTYGSVCGMSWGGYVTALAKTPGQVAEDTGVKKKLQQLASKLVLTFNA